MRVLERFGPREERPFRFLWLARTSSSVGNALLARDERPEHEVHAAADVREREAGATSCCNAVSQKTFPQIVEAKNRPFATITAGSGSGGRRASAATLPSGQTANAAAIGRLGRNR